MNKIQINSIDLDVADLAELRRTLEDAIGQVRHWWGSTYDGDFVIDVEQGRGPSRALVPAWRGDRGRIQFHSEPIRRQRAAVIHEVLHVFAPNANRMLAEGLAVHAHEILEGHRTYPNYGGDIHQAAKPHATEVDLAELDGIPTPRRLNQDNGRIAGLYMIAGSFVRFLIETKGMNRFRTLYALTPMVPGERIPSDPNRWQGVYGVSLGTLEQEWKEFLAKQD